MYILGLSEGHGSTAALLKDGKIIGCTSEERFNRVKGYAGFPEQSINYLLTSAGIDASDLDKVILPSLHPFSFFMEDEKPLHKKSFYNKLFNMLLSDPVYWRTAKIGNRYPFIEKIVLHARNIVNQHIVQKKMVNLRIQALSRQLHIDRVKIVSTSHQFAHALIGYYAYPEISDKETLILTGDGMGNHSCAAVYIAKDNTIRTVSKTPNFHSLAFIYGMITKYLGMKFLEHEYKVMGLAPYADQEGVQKTYEILRELITVEDDLRFHSKNSTRVVYYFLEEKMKRHRFDWIAGAAQKLVEELVTEWVRKAVEQTGIRTVVLGGGLFMNVKANMAVMEMPEVEKVYPCPSASDESCAIGASIYGYLYENGTKIPDRAVEPLSDLYLGPAYADSDMTAALSAHQAHIRYQYCSDIESRVAQLLSENKVVARFNHKMEFGPRALGNRSIFANPSCEDTVEVINRQVKNRDFWMPFAATILKERQADYIKNPKEVPAPFMSMAFPTTALGATHFKAGIHRYDKTMRPQILEEKTNPSYHKLIKEFEKRTGIGGVLNTSFNLHGSPIVCNPVDAVDTFLNSGLEYLAIGNYLASKE